MSERVLEGSTNMDTLCKQCDVQTDRTSHEIGSGLCMHSESEGTEQGIQGVET